MSLSVFSIAPKWFSFFIMFFFSLWNKVTLSSGALVGSFHRNVRWGGGPHQLAMVKRSRGDKPTERDRKLHDFARSIIKAIKLGTGLFILLIVRAPMIQILLAKVCIKILFSLTWKKLINICVCVCVLHMQMSTGQWQGIEKTIGLIKRNSSWKTKQKASWCVVHWC